MRMPRVSIASTKCDVTEEVNGDHVTLWRLPYHGCYPSEAIARQVAKAHQCSDAWIRPVTFYNAPKE